MLEKLLKYRLSPLDAAFVYFESDTAPMHVGGLNLYEGRVSFRRYLHLLEEKLPYIPRYRQRLAAAPLNLGHPGWEADPAFDVRNHIHLIRPRSVLDDDQLRRLAARLLSARLDRGRPLWEQFVIQNITGGRTALVSKVHHCLVDGVSAVELAEIVHDHAPTPAAEAPAPAPRAECGTNTVVDALWDTVVSEVERWTDLEKGAIEYGHALAADRVRDTLRGSAKVLLRYRRPLVRLPFNGAALSGRKSYACLRLSFADVRAVRNAACGTINDVVLAVVAMALSKYVRRLGLDGAGKNALVMVPVSLRREDRRGLLGNCVSMLPVALPLDTMAPRAVLEQIHEETRTLKDAAVADGLHLLLRAAQGLPPALQALALRAARTPRWAAAFSLLTAYPGINLVCTNVPGPQTPLYLLGRRLLESYPFLPVAERVGLSVGVLSYNQELFVGIIGDAATLPDAWRLRRYMEASFLELRRAVG